MLSIQNKLTLNQLNLCHQYYLLDPLANYSRHSHQASTSQGVIAVSIGLTLCTGPHLRDTVQDSKHPLHEVGFGVIGRY